MASPATAKLSLVNHVASATIGGTSPLAGYPLANIKTPQLPMVSYRSGLGSGTGTAIIPDLGSAKAMEVVVLVNINFTGWDLYLNDTPDFDTPIKVVNAITVTRNLWNDRYSVAVLLGASYAARYIYVSIPAQTTFGGGDYFECGGIWAGPLAALPRGFRWGWTGRPERPTDEQRGANRQTYRVLTGEPFAVFRGEMFADLTETPATFGGPGELTDWRDVLRRWWLPAGLGYAALYLDKGSTAEAFIVRPNAPEWRIGFPFADATLEFEEVLNG